MKPVEQAIVTAEAARQAQHKQANTRHAQHTAARAHETLITVGVILVAIASVVLLVMKGGG